MSDNKAAMNHTTESQPIDAVQTAAQDIKSEILQDIDAGLVPATVSTFAELHDYVDANTYGAFTAQRADWNTPDLVCVQDLVQDWLQTGRPVQST